MCGNRIVVVAVCTAALVAGGCSGESASDSPQGKQHKQGSKAGSQTQAPQQGETVSAKGFTKSGTTLSFGQKAIVPLESQDRRGKIGIAVTGIDKGTPAELAPLELGDQAAGMVPYYIRATVTNESGTDFSFTGSVDLNGLLPDGSEAQSVSVIGSFEPCNNDGAGEGFTTKGATYQTCTLVLANSTTPVTSASYTNTTYSDSIPNTDYFDNPVTWQH